MPEERRTYEHDPVARSRRLRDLMPEHEKARFDGEVRRASEGLGEGRYIAKETRFINSAGLVVHLERMIKPCPNSRRKPSPHISVVLQKESGGQSPELGHTASVRNAPTKLHEANKGPGLLRQELDELLSQARQKLIRLVGSLEGTRRETIEESREIATLIQGYAQQCRVAFRCPTCGEPARLRCIEVGGSRSGQFIFAHAKTTHGGSAAFPALEVIDAPDDLRKKSATSDE